MNQRRTCHKLRLTQAEAPYSLKTAILERGQGMVGRGQIDYYACPICRKAKWPEIYHTTSQSGGLLKHFPERLARDFLLAFEPGIEVEDSLKDKHRRLSNRRHNENRAGRTRKGPPKHERLRKH